MKKKNIPWIVGLIFVIIWISFNSPTEAVADEEYVGPEPCKQCHLTQYDEWRKTKHAEAYTDPEFQEKWSSESNPEACLQCHTTGYDTETQEYATEGVTCEACHGVGYTMQINNSSELCGSCHSGEYGKYRYEQYLDGTHAVSDVTCVDCHLTEANHSFEIQAETCSTCHTEERIHGSSLIIDTQAKVLESEDKVSELETLTNDLNSKLADVESRTGFVSQLTQVGGVALFLVIIIVVVNYLHKKQS